MSLVDLEGLAIAASPLLNWKSPVMQNEMNWQSAYILWHDLVYNIWNNWSTYFSCQFHYGRIYVWPGSGMFQVLANSEVQLWKRWNWKNEKKNIKQIKEPKFKNLYIYIDICLKLPSIECGPNFASLIFCSIHFLSNTSLLLTFVFMGSIPDMTIFQLSLFFSSSTSWLNKTLIPVHSWLFGVRS